VTKRSFFDEIEAAHERERARIKQMRAAERLVDDVDPASREPDCGECVPCMSGLTHIMPCLGGGKS
jgi:hypothetical protein